ncbi:MAG: ERCC4 domain-containing protein [Nanoarchaeota archaeon]|nr:ERCC4 domain-containing protein [Nanoarchaeota archaeon]
MFHNIFSNKKIKEQPKVKIIVDHREKNSLVISELMSQGIDIEFRQLEVADYIIGDIAIERKTGIDLIGSMITKRIFFQLESLKQYDRSLIIIESYQDINLSESKLSENAIRGLILSLALEHRIPLIFTKDPKETATFIALLTRRKKSEISLRSKIPMSDSKTLQFIIEGFPSIGPVTAKKLLSKYKSLKSIVNAPEDEIKSLLGKKADIFLDLLKLEYQVEE